MKMNYLFRSDFLFLSREKSPSIFFCFSLVRERKKNRNNTETLTSTRDMVNYISTCHSHPLEWFDNHWRACTFSCTAFVMWKSVCIFTIRLLECYSGRTAHLARLRSKLRIQLGLSPSGWGEFPQYLMSSNWLCLPGKSGTEWENSMDWKVPTVSIWWKEPSVELFCDWLWPVMPFTTLLDFPGDLSRGPLKGDRDSKGGL